MTLLVTDSLPEVLGALLGLYGSGQPAPGRSSVAQNIAENIRAAVDPAIAEYTATRGMQSSIAAAHAGKDDVVHSVVADSGAGTVAGRDRVSDQIADYQTRVRAIAAVGDTRFGGAALLDAAQTAITNASRQVDADVSAAREQAAKIMPTAIAAPSRNGKPVQPRRRRRSSSGRRHRNGKSRVRTLVPSDGTAGGNAAKVASDWVGTPYVWGGGGAEGPSDGGFDCSGLTQYAIAQASHGRVILPRTTYQQIYSGVRVPIQDVRPGDLVFPASSFSARGPEHVQLAAGNGMVIEAPHTGSTVTVSRMPSQAVVVRVL
jgi:cell wall-associated NlpC family hydrolase